MNFWNKVLLVWISISCTSNARSENATLHVQGPERAFTGDFEKFKCVLEGNGVNGGEGVQWLYLKKDDTKEVVQESDMLKSLELSKYSVETSELEVTSFIRIGPDVVAIGCAQSPSSPREFYSLIVQDLNEVFSTDADEPCLKAQKTGKPVVVMHTFSMDDIASYRKGHYIEREVVEVSYPFDVSQTRLVCVGHDNSPTWTMKSGTADKMKFTAWSQNSFGTRSCKRQSLDILQVDGTSGGVTRLSFECNAGSGKSAPVEINYHLPTSRSGPDYNKTEECVNTIVDQFYGKELTGVGVGSSVLIVLMMVGMAIMKKQMNQQQQKINQQLQSGGQGAAGDAGVRSTEQLSPASGNIA